MIKSWKHKGLKNFYERGDKSGIKSQHAKRLKIILQRLNAAIEASDMNTPGMKFHKLTGKLKEHYSMTVNKNWRVIFKFDNGDAVLVNYLDYH